jgi:multiple sugar transport system ATP-binding protein
VAEVRLDKVVKRYAGTEVVHGIDLDVAHNEFVVLVGPSGCGKSTTLRMVAGLEDISDGIIEIGGKVVNALPPRSRNISMVFQSYALYPHMSVRENMAFGLKNARVPAQEIERRIADAARVLEIEPLLDRKPAQMSGGQRQRVALGRAIVRDPKVFLFDEPLSNLDAALRVGMRGELIKLHQRLGATMIYVTHDQVEAMTMGDRICIMEGGKVVQTGAPLDVYRTPANTFVAGFLGSPPTNLMPARFDADRLVVGATVIPLSRRDAPESVVFGIRPEDVRIDGDGAHAQGEVLAVEPLGAETIVRFRIAGIAQDVLVRGPRTVTARVGELVPLAFDLPAAHLFDPATQRRIA